MGEMIRSRRADGNACQVVVKGQGQHPAAITIVMTIQDDHERCNCTRDCMDELSVLAFDHGSIQLRGR